MINIEQVLNDLYDSEIDFHMGFNWDGGWDYAFHNNPYPLFSSVPADKIQHTGVSDLQQVFRYVIDDAIKEFPESKFAKKYK